MNMMIRFDVLNKGLRIIGVSWRKTSKGWESEVETVAAA